MRHRSRKATVRPRRRRRILRWFGGLIGAVLIVAIVGTLIYTQVGVMAAEPAPLTGVRADDRITVRDSSRAIVMTPVSGASAVGLVYIPGAKVDPWAYASKLSGVVADDGITVVVTKPWLNLALFDLRPLTSFTDLAPDVDDWIVGGHSLGGVRACQLAEDADGLALFGSYCANDLADAGVPVLSVGAATTDSRRRRRSPTPATCSRSALSSSRSTGRVTRPSATTADQAGDGTPTISDTDMTAQITELVEGLASRVAAN